MRYVYGKWDLLPVDGMIWLDDWALVSEFEPCLLIGQDMKLNHIFWLVRAESGTLIGQNLRTENMWTEPWIVIGQNLMTEKLWAEPWVVIGQNLRTENMWAEPWVVIGQNLMTENMWAEPWVVIGQDLMTENCELNCELWLVRTCWVNPASWLAKTNYVLIKLLYTMYLYYVIFI